MTDLHTHILPGMDDGPADPEQTRLLLERQRVMGVKRVALTSHYLCDREPPEAFLARREEAFAAASAVCPAGLELKRGCEVFFSPGLLSAEPERLCLEGTNVLLLELPVLQKPAFLSEVLTGLRSRGIVPMLAHVERYAYVRRDPALLCQWRELGCLIQLNAADLDGFALKLIKWGLADVIASDAHSLEYRPPNLRRGLDRVSKALGRDQALQLERNAAAVFAGRSIPRREHRVPRRVLGLWI